MYYKYTDKYLTCDPEWDEHVEHQVQAAAAQDVEVGQSRHHFFDCTTFISDVPLVKTSPGKIVYTVRRTA